MKIAKREDFRLPVNHFVLHKEIATVSVYTHHWAPPKSINKKTLIMRFRFASFFGYEKAPQFR